MEAKKYQAILYAGTKKVSGHVSLKDRHLLFTSAEPGEKEHKWDEYSMSATFEDELVGIHSTLEPDLSIFVKDPQFAAAFRKELGVKVQSSFIHWWARRPVRAAMALTVVIFLSTTLFLAFLRTQGKFF